MRDGQRHLFRVDRSGLSDPLVADVLNLAQVIGCDALVVRKVETQLGRRDEGALLIDVVPEHRAQGKVEDMGAGVVVADGPSAEL